MRITVHIPDSIGQEAEETAREEETSVSALFARAMERFLEERRRARAARRITALIGEAAVSPEALSEVVRDRARSDRQPD